MSEPAFKYASEEARVVVRTWPDGRSESCSVEADVVRAWIEAGNTPEPADPAPEPEPPPLTAGQLAAVLQAKGVLTRDEIEAAGAASADVPG